MNAVDTSTKREQSSNKDGESRPDKEGGCRKNNTPEPHRTPCQLRRRGRMGHGAFWTRFFGALDGLSRRTLILLPPSAERPSETPLFDSTPPAAAAMVAAAVSRRHMRPFSRRQEIAPATRAAMAVSQSMCGTAKAVARPVRDRTMRDSAKAVRRRKSADGGQL